MSTDLTNTLVNPLFGIGYVPSSHTLTVPSVSGITAVEVALPVTAVTNTDRFPVPSNAYTTSPVASVVAGRLRLTPATSMRLLLRVGVQASTTTTAPAAPADLPVVQIIIRLFDQAGASLGTNRVDLSCSKYNGGTTEYRFYIDTTLAYSTARTFIEVSFAATYTGLGTGTCATTTVSAYVQ